MDPVNCPSPVRQQYERYPYPERCPDDERRRLVFFSAESLPVLNHRCFRGTRSFDDGFRVLIAGGGTGDSAIQFGEQLAGRNAEVVYLDVSRASMEIARARAAVRGLNNIRWVHGSILDLHRLDLGTFDYVNCTGVLHHLEDPDSGLRQLASAMADDGALGLMVYGAYGRTAVYQMQRLMRLVDGDETDLASRVRNTRAVLDHLPPTNWYARSAELFHPKETEGDAGLVDLFLHPQDRAYSIPELYAWLERCDLQMIDLAGPRYRYDPDLIAGDRRLREIWSTKPERARQAIAELLRGDIATHSFYCARDGDRTARLDEPDMVPFLWSCRSNSQALADLSRPGEQGQTVFGNAETPVSIAYSRMNASIFKHLDGTRTVSELMAAVAADPGADRPAAVEVATQIKRLFDVLGQFDQMLLRHRSIGWFPDGDELQRRRFG